MRRWQLKNTETWLAESIFDPTSKDPYSPGGRIWSFCHWVKYREASNCHKKVLEAAKSTYANKIRV